MLDRELSSESLAVMVDSMHKRATGSSSSSSPGERGTPEGEWSGADIGRSFCNNTTAVERGLNESKGLEFCDGVKEKCNTERRL